MNQQIDLYLQTLSDYSLRLLVRIMRRPGQVRCNIPDHTSPVTTRPTCCAMRAWSLTFDTRESLRRKPPCNDVTSGKRALPSGEGSHEVTVLDLGIDCGTFPWRQTQHKTGVGECQFWILVPVRLLRLLWNIQSITPYRSKGYRLV